MSARADIKYLVEKYHGYWTVMFSGKRNGKFSGRGEACHSALQDGIRVGHLGHEVEIEAREQSGDTRTVWTSKFKSIRLPSRRCCRPIGVADRSPPSGSAQ